MCGFLALVFLGVMALAFYSGASLSVSFFIALGVSIVVGILLWKFMPVVGPQFTAEDYNGEGDSSARKR